jgi:hypothetical protein
MYSACSAHPTLGCLIIFAENTGYETQHNAVPLHSSFVYVSSELETK